MKKIIIVFLFLLLIPFISKASMQDALEGRILLQVEGEGQAWYVVPGVKERAYLGRPDDAFKIMRELGLGITEDFFVLWSGYAPAQLKGKILLRVQANGEAYYVNTKTRELHYLGRPEDAFQVMREQGLGISNYNLKSIPIHAKYPEYTPEVPQSEKPNKNEDLNQSNEENKVEEISNVEIGTSTTLNIASTTECMNASGTATTTCNIIPSPMPPKINFIANNETGQLDLVVGEKIYLFWDTETATSCSASGFSTWNGEVATSGIKEILFSVPGERIFELKCWNDNGTTTKEIAINIGYRISDEKLDVFDNVGGIIRLGQFSIQNNSHNIDNILTINQIDLAIDYQGTSDIEIELWDEWGDIAKTTINKNTQNLIFDIDNYRINGDTTITFTLITQSEEILTEGMFEYSISNVLYNEKIYLEETNY